MILSAQHGLVDPEEVLEPYDLTLRDLDAAERARWGSRVAHQLRDLCGDPIPPVVFLAGLPYRAALTPHLPRYRVPMYGLGIGEQLAWLDRNTA